MHRAIATLESPGHAPATWWLCWQAALGRDFFVDPTLHARIRERLIDAHRRPGRVLVDYLLLPTEIHAVAQISPGDSAGGVARAVGNVLARWVRQVQPVRSPVLAGPYRSHLIASPDELRDEVRMLAWRPVFLGLCRTPTHYRHGALRISLGLTPAQGFDARSLLRLFGESVPQARAALRSRITRRPTEQEWRSWELRRGLVLATDSTGPPAHGGRAVHGAAAAFIAAGGTYEIDGALRLLETWVAARLEPRSVLDLHQAANAVGAHGRALVACLAVQHRICSAAAVARHFGRAKATLSEQMNACRSRPTDRHIVDTPVRRILEESAALASTVHSDSRR